MIGDYKIKRDSTTIFSAVNDTYDLGLPIYEVDEHRLKIGNGIDNYNTLPHLNFAGERRKADIDLLTIDRDTSGGDGNEVFLTYNSYEINNPELFEDDGEEIILKKSGVYWLSMHITLNKNVDGSLRLYWNDALTTAQDFTKSVTDLSKRNIRFTFMEYFNKGDKVKFSIVNYTDNRDATILADSVSFALKVA
jgi:hypothetical protein